MRKQLPTAYAQCECEWQGQSMAGESEDVGCVFLLEALWSSGTALLSSNSGEGLFIYTFPQEHSVAVKKKNNNNEKLKRLF